MADSFDVFEKQLAELSDMLTALGEKIPEKTLQRVTRGGAKTVLGAIRVKAPSRTNTLRMGLKLNKEKIRKPWLSVTDVIVDPMKNTIFQKPIKKPVLSKSNHAYYPASMEYGYFTRRAGGGLRYVSPAFSKTSNPTRIPGKYFMRSGAISSEETAKRAMIESIWEDIKEKWEG